MSVLVWLSVWYQPQICQFCFGWSFDKNVFWVKFLNSSAAQSNTWFHPLLRGMTCWPWQHVLQANLNWLLEVPGDFLVACPASWPTQSPISMPHRTKEHKKSVIFNLIIKKASKLNICWSGLCGNKCTYFKTPHFGALWGWGKNWWGLYSVPCSFFSLALQTSCIQDILCDLLEKNIYTRGCFSLKTRTP